MLCHSLRTGRFSRLLFKYYESRSIQKIQFFSASLTFCARLSVFFSFDTHDDFFFCCLDTTRRRGRQFHAFGMACHSFQRHQIFASPCVVCHFVFWSGSLLGAVPCFFLSLSRLGCSAVEGTASYTRKGNHFPAQWNAGVLVMIHKPVDCKDKAANATLLAAGARTWC